MLSLSEGLLFVWEPADLVISWHVPQKWSGGGTRKILVKNIVMGQKILILTRGCIMEWVNILMELQGILEKIENCMIGV